MRSTTCVQVARCVYCACVFAGDKRSRDNPRPSSTRYATIDFELLLFEIRLEVNEWVRMQYLCRPVHIDERRVRRSMVSVRTFFSYSVAWVAILAIVDIYRPQIGLKIHMHAAATNTLLYPRRTYVAHLPPSVPTNNASPERRSKRLPMIAT